MTDSAKKEPKLRLTVVDFLTLATVKLFRISRYYLLAITIDTSLCSSYHNWYIWGTKGSCPEILDLIIDFLFGIVEFIAGLLGSNC